MSGPCPTCGSTVLAYVEVEEHTSRTSGQFKNFSGHLFALHGVLTVDAALEQLRTCWGGGTFDGWISAHPHAVSEWIDGLAAREDVLSKTCVMAATSEELQAVCPGECAPSDGLVALDANHRLTAVALRRSRGRTDSFKIPVYVPHVCRST